MIHTVGFVVVHAGVDDTGFSDRTETGRARGVAYLLRERTSGPPPPPPRIYAYSLEEEQPPRRPAATYYIAPLWCVCVCARVCASIGRCCRTSDNNHYVQ